MHKIAGFCKTEHFCFRQWDRQISDKILTHVLKHMDPNMPNTLCIVSRKVLRKINRNMNTELFIKIDRTTLITCFYCDFQEYCSGGREQKYVIINQI
ncbi:hypothetical protein GCM10022291_24420 [Postechiella marina]|uniref:Uncharacterized protein n=1 Tax=Postechiella marina TaxID=943941 RepID=A0ABP8CC99_9FLAO